MLCRFAKISHRERKSAFVYIAQPHSYTVKKILNLTAIGSDPLTKVYMKMAERVSLPVPINIHSRLSQCLFCGLAISLLSVEANYFAQTLFSSKSNMIVHSEQSVTCTQEHVYIILACCAPPSFFVFSLL